MAKRNSFTRVGRLLGACAVAGALVAGPLAAAGGAATPDLSSFAGQGTGFALRVVVDLSGLPQAAKDAVQTLYAPVAAASGGKLPANFPFVIDQRFLETLSQLGTNTQAHALLGQGVLQDVLGKVLPTNLNKSADASKVGDNNSVESSKTGLPTDSLPILGMGIGSLNAAIPTSTKATSSGTLASVAPSLEGLLNVLPDAVKQALTDAIASINSTIDTVNGTGVGSLGSALDTVGNALAGTTDPVVSGILGQAGLPVGAGSATQLVQQLQQTVQLPHVDNLLNTITASVNGLVNTAAAEKSAGKAFSDATSHLNSINVANLLKVRMIDLKSHSEAGGTAGTAKNTNSCTIGSASLTQLVSGKDSGVSLDGKNLIVNGLPVPVPAVDVASVLNAVNTVTSKAGLTVTMCDAANAKAAADGTSASQTLSALRIVFAPVAVGAPDVGNALGITQGTPLVKVIIDPSVSTAASAQVAAPAAAAQLPHTGAAPLATALTGLIVAGGALVLRRRLAA